MQHRGGGVKVGRVEVRDGRSQVVVLPEDLQSLKRLFKSDEQRERERGMLMRVFGQIMESQQAEAEAK